MRPRLKRFQVVLAGAAVVLPFFLPTAWAQTGPSITQQPASQTVVAGTNVTLSVAVSGTGPFKYQWQFNGTNLPNDIITTVAGNGIESKTSFDGWQEGTYSGDGGAATNAGLSLPSGVALDASGNVFIADFYNNRIRKVGLDEIITTAAGNGSGTFSGDGGEAIKASLNGPEGVTVDASGNLFIADFYNNRIRKVDVNGIVTTVAGDAYLNPNTGQGGYSGDGGEATNAGLNAPQGVAVDASGNLIIADFGNSVIRKVDTRGIITTVAGNGSAGFSGDGGPATNATLTYPSAVAVDTSGNLFIVDTFNNRLREVDANGIITTVAGGGTAYPGDGGAATNAALHFAGLGMPVGVTVDDSGTVFFADTLGERIRKVVHGIISTVAGNGSICYEGLGEFAEGCYSGDGGPATNASLDFPLGVAMDLFGNLFIADEYNNRIREVHFGGLPTIFLNNISPSVAGAYQVIVTSPYGSVTSMVATLTVVVPPTIVMSPPFISGPSLLLGFTLSQGTNTSFTLLQTPNLTGPWTTNTAAVLTTNSQAGGFQFTIPTPGSVEFFQVRSP